MHRHLVLLILGATLTGGCAGNGVYGTYGYGYGVSAYPDLVYAGPGVYAVAGFDYPIYYANDYYWRFYDGRWYRSSRYTGGWQYYRRPPVVISRIERPYSHYGRYGRRVHVDRRDYRDYRDYRRPVYRDYRRDYRDYRDRSRPVYRDYRDRSRPVYRGSPARPSPRVDRGSPPRIDRGASPRVDRGSQPRVIRRDR